MASLLNFHVKFGKEMTLLTWLLLFFDTVMIKVPGEPISLGFELMHLFFNCKLRVLTIIHGCFNCKLKVLTIIHGCFLL